ncbi:MAG: hypothetical protein M1832_004813 [Thelocarpon impressellum]|nr:MAG: hypothetical protein M1832_004813 [Thelocarpon impressellum]
MVLSAVFGSFWMVVAVILFVNSFVPRSSFGGDGVTQSVTVTVSNCPSISSGYSAALAVTSGNLLHGVAASQEEHLTITHTETAYITKVVEQTASSQQAAGGPFYYVGENGTSFFLGGVSPSGTVGLTTHTSTFVVSPVPQQTSGSEDSTTTVHLTSTITVQETITQTETSSSASSIVAHGFTGIGAGGWNSTTRAQEATPSGTGASASGAGAVGTGFTSRTFSTFTSMKTQTPSGTITASPSTKVANSTTSSAPEPTCGETGIFTLDFDDLPTFATGNNDTATFPPLFTPYHHLTFSEGFTFVPPPTVPFPPTSQPRLAAYIVNSGAAITVDDPRTPPKTIDGTFGSLGAGLRLKDSTYWIDAYGASLGCDNGGVSDCNITVFGYSYSPVTGKETLAAEEIFTIPPCPEFKDCNLFPVDFAPTYRGLSTLILRALVGNRPVNWFIDDLHLGWSNSSCAAGLVRKAAD